MELPAVKVFPSRSPSKTLAPTGEPTMVVMPEMVSVLEPVQVSPVPRPTLPVSMLAVTPQMLAEKSAVFPGPAPVKEYPPAVPAARKSVLPVAAPVKVVKPLPPVEKL